MYANSKADEPVVQASKLLIRAVASGQLQATTSPAVIEEVWHLELSGRLSATGGVAAGAIEILSPLVTIDERTIRRALALAAPATLGANDRLHVATCIEHEIPAIVSADRAFDGVAEIERIDPLDGEAIGSLLSPP